MDMQQLHPTVTAISSTDAQYAQACQQGLVRTLQALFREKLLDASHLVVEGSIAWLPLWSQKTLLRFEGLELGRIGSCQLVGGITCHKTGNRPYPIKTPSALLRAVADALPMPVSLADLERLCLELENSIDNDALCLTYREKWGRELLRSRGDHRYFLTFLRTSNLANPLLTLEQWGTIGHPWHPTYKTKLGLSAVDVMRMSPEFQAELKITIAAIKKDQVHAELQLEATDPSSDISYSVWFARQFPNAFAHWQEALTQRGYAPDDWVPLPIHPYQAERFIDDEFAAEIAQGTLVLLDNVSIPASPTMSFRTVVPEHSDAMPHMKLPVSLRLTSVERTVSPKSAVMGPRITQLLRRILAVEQGFGQRLEIVGEDVGVHYLDPNQDDNRSRHLAVLYRQNPLNKRTDALFPLPVGALFSSSAYAKRPLIAELVALGYGGHDTAAAEFFQQYTQTVLTATLSAYLIYGIAFEAHQQNSFMLVDQAYRPVCLLARDFGDVRVHASTLEKMQYTLDPFRAGHTVYDDHMPVRDKILHAVMLCHLSEMALLLARTTQQSALIFWTVLREQTIQVFDALRPRTNPERWEAEREAFLELPWPAKAFLRMRLSNTQEDVHGQMPNPLKAI
ncbi:IucA/IucC family protein [Aquirhabdus parva]|uniref:IucA/IucC family siderophore biosynthesis protein n=1 Tax=Aquirhabdus parva TaxID=2283318 RepID=A0A345PA26_9GAMM|nr:IucA/IucC family protein [Aquirhabdus parva]AXI04135.1 IucA/IucC family siderophore biosynthesis protein [Aquirhabdus parva]